ncbi:MAG: flavodoxin [bacterium]|nr:flavodoxin [bacterium]
MKILIAYYSAGGNTRYIATEIAKRLEAHIVEQIRIEPEQEYTNVFSRYIIGSRRAKREVRTKIRPTKSDLNLYDLLILGFPIWAGKLPSPVLTYIDSLTNCSGKKVITFASSYWNFNRYKKVGKNELEAKGMEVILALSFRGRAIKEDELAKIDQIEGAEKVV